MESIVFTTKSYEMLQTISNNFTSSYKCGTSNGSHEFCYKNKYCDVMFKESDEKRKLSTKTYVNLLWTHLFIPIKNR